MNRSTVPEPVRTGTGIGSLSLGENHTQNRSVCVTLRGGLVVHLAAIELLLDLERRGVQLTCDDDGVLFYAPADHVTDADRIAIKQHEAHIATLIAYCDQEHA